MLFSHITEVIDPQPHDAALNMAIDETLLHAATGPLLRIYRWARPAVSFGYFLKHRDIAAGWPQREIVRRWTGGGAVPHGEDLTYSLIIPRTCRTIFEMPPLDTYRAIHEGLARWLGGAFAVAKIASPKTSEACFENPVQYDLLADGRKIAGAAQRRTRGGLLHQGSVQNIPAADFPAVLANAWSSASSPRLLTPEEIAAAQGLADQKYLTEAWLRRY